jgi:transposase
MVETGSQGIKRRRPGGGRKPKLQPEHLALLRQFVEAKPSSSSIELASALARAAEIRVGKNTVISALKGMGLSRVKPVKAAKVEAVATPTHYTSSHRRTAAPGKYASSLTDAEWAVVEPIWAATRDSRGRKPSIDRRHLLDAVFYLARTGSQWRMLPHDFPAWPAVWSLFRRLRDRGVLERMYDQMHKLWRTLEQRAELPTAGIIDSQTVKTTEKGDLTATTPAKRSKAASDT